MTDSIDAIFQSLHTRLGIHPSGIAVIALLLVLILAVVALFVFTKLKRARGVIAELAERLGYEPPYGDGEEIVHEEVRKDIVQRGKLVKVEQLEIRVGELEAEGQHKDANFEALQKHSQELDEKLRQVTLQNDALGAQAGDQSKMHKAVVEQFEKRLRDMEAEHSSSLSALHARSKDLEDQLQQAFLRNDKVMALANDQAQAHQRTVAQFDQQQRDIEAENNAKLTALQRRSKELEEQVRQAFAERDGAVSQVDGQIQAHKDVAIQLEQRLRQLEEESNRNLQALEQRDRQVEEELHNALREKDALMVQASEQARAHGSAVGQLEEHIRQLESEGKANLNGLQARVRELEEQLRQVYLQRDQVMAQASEQSQAHRETLAQVEQRIRDIEVQGNASLNALEQRSRDLEEQLQQAAEHHARITTQASEQARTHGETVALLEDRIRQIEMERNEHLGGLQHHARELEEQLRQVTQHRDAIAAQAGEMARAQGETVAQLEDRILQIESERNLHFGALQEHAQDVEEQLRQVTAHRDAIAAQATELERAHGETVAQLQERFRQTEVERDEHVGTLQQRAREFEEQLRQSNLHRESIAAQAGEMVRAHGETVEQMEGRIRQLEGEGNEKLTALQQRTDELEEQLERANLRHVRESAQAGEQVQAYRSSVEKLEERIRELEAEGSANVTALQQRAKELEEELQRAHSHHESEKSVVQQEVQDRAANVEQLTLRIRDLEAERDGREAHVESLHGRISELEEQQRQTANRIAAEVVEIPKADSSAGTAEQLMRKAEWITARSIGTVLPQGLVAAEAYASAALAADPHRSDAGELLAELTRIRRAFPQGLPPVPEAVTTFDERANAFIAVDPAQAAELAEDEARRRSRAGLNRSALLVTNMALELREKTDAPDSPMTMQLQELKAALVDRLG